MGDPALRGWQSPTISWVMGTLVTKACCREKHELLPTVLICQSTSIHGDLEGTELQRTGQVGGHQGYMKRKLQTAVSIVDGVVIPREF